MSPHIDAGALLPCPFCGQQPKCSTAPIRDDLPPAICFECPDGCSVSKTATTYGGAVAIWNTRIPVRQAAPQGSAGGERSEVRTVDILRLLQASSCFSDGAICRMLPCACAETLATFGAAQASREPGFIKPDNDRKVFFYEQDFYVLSNFSSFAIVWQGLRFPTSEHAYHWEKFKDGHNEHAALQIRRASSAHEAFKIAERAKDTRRRDWDAVKVDIMRDILRVKASQHEYVARKLLATGDRELIEDSWRDNFWGWGPNRHGQNMLGKLWMEVRAEMRASPVPSAERK